MILLLLPPGPPPSLFLIFTGEAEDGKRLINAPFPLEVIAVGVAGGAASSSSPWQFRYKLEYVRGSKRSVRAYPLSE